MPDVFGLLSVHVSLYVCLLDCRFQCVLRRLTLYASQCEWFSDLMCLLTEACYPMIMCYMCVPSARALYGQHSISVSQSFCDLGLNTLLFSFLCLSLFAYASVLVWGCGCVCPRIEPLQRLMVLLVSVM